MKKITIICLVLILLFSFTSCTTVNKSIELSGDQKSIQSIDIYDVSEQYYEGDITVLRSENTPIYTVNPEQYADFLDELLLLDFEEEAVFFPIPMDGGCDYFGYVISIVYTDGGYDIVAEEGQFSYSLGVDGKGRYKYEHADYCGDVSWVDFVEKYIEK